MKRVEHIEHTLHDLTRPKRSHTFWGFVGVLLVAAALVWAKHGNWLGTPNDYILGESGDGFKNYMTTAWHVTRDSSYTHFGGMGYPYGEHVLFTDNQPLLSAAMMWWSHQVSDLNERTVGLVNIFQVLSLLFGAGVIFLLLRKLHLPVWYAGLAALGLTFLSPQYSRFDGHFGLSHIWVFPLLLLLLCRYEERHSRRYQSLHIGILVCLVAQLHFYYFGLLAIFLTLYTGIQILTAFNARNIRVRMSHWVVMVLIPFMLLNIWIHWSDYCPDRPAHPFGFFYYVGYWEGIFLPYQEFPIFKWIDSNIIHIRRVDFETQAYIGMAALFYWGYLLYSRFRMFDKTWEEAAYHRVHKRYLIGIFAAATVLLLFACGFPFAIKGCEWVAEYIGPLKQFRGLGRFSWAFYYVINTLMFYVAWNYSTRFKGFENGRFPKFRWVIALAPLLLVCYEAYTFQQIKQLKLNPNVAKREVFAASPDHWLNKVDFSQFQALMPIPYYHVGSENIWMDLDGGAVFYRKMHATALHTGLPDMGVNMSRTPISRMVKSVQFAHLSCITPELLDDLPDNRPIALMVNPSRWLESQQPYRHLLSKATKLYESSEMIVLSLAPDSLRTFSREVAEGISKEMDDSTRFDAADGFRSNHPVRFLLHEDFDSLTNSKYVFQGRGAYKGVMSDTTWLLKAHMPQGDYYTSMWIYVKEDMGMTHELKIFENDPKDGREVHYYHEGLRFYLRTIVNGWALFDFHFQVYEPNSNLRIFLHKKDTKLPFWLDEVMIKDGNLDLYKRTPGWVAKDGFWFKRM